MTASGALEQAAPAPPSVVHVITELGPTEGPGFVVQADLGDFRAWRPRPDGVYFGDVPLYYYAGSGGSWTSAATSATRPPNSWTVR